MVGGDLAFETAGTKITTNQAIGKSVADKVIVKLWSVII